MATMTNRINSATAYEIRKRNVVLAKGEPFYELDTGGLKIGNGTQRYNELAYAGVVSAEHLIVSPLGKVFRLKVSEAGALSTELVT